MKNEWIEKEQCPYCKRHCSLKTPHCGKGKSLVKSMTAKADKVMGEPEMEELKKLLSELRLFLLCEKANESIIKRTNGKSRGKRLKNFILYMLAEKSGISPKELKESSGLEKEELKKVLEKLSDKGEISIQDNKEEGRRLFLTDKGKNTVLQQLAGKEYGGENLFSVLEEEEKENLEKILRKLIGALD